MELDLEVRERFMLLLVIPKTGNIRTIPVHRKLRNLLALNKEELLELGLKKGDILTSELTDKAEAKLGSVKFTFNRLERTVLKEKLRNIIVQLNTTDRLTQGHLDLTEKFFSAEDYQVFIGELTKSSEVEEQALADEYAEELSEIFR